MGALSGHFTRTRDANPELEPVSGSSGEASGGGQVPAPSGESETVTAISDGEADVTTSGEGERKRALMEKLPNDVLPFCFGDFDAACRAPCGHWYCGSCILQYWNFSATLQPCNVLCVPESSLYHRHQDEITKVLRDVGDYNRLFVGGISGFMLIPLYMKRTFLEMLNPDRPGVYLHEMRVIAMLLGILYSFIPLDFLQIE